MPAESLNDLLPTTPDLRQERLDELKRLFPDLFTNEGRLDPDELKRLVAPNEVHETERYEFKWYGKAASKREAFTPTTATLVYDEARSVNPDKADGNMIIEGENLETLKLLLSAYREQVKVIYIDPPYNTGEDFIYRDNYRKEKSEYWAEAGISVGGIRLESNPESSGKFHSDWISMINARLLVAHSLLKRDGVLFVSIDDNEVNNLRRILDQTFGNENFIAQVVWEGAFKNDAKQIGTNHEYVLVYAKDRNQLPREWGLRKEGVEPVLREAARLQKEFRGRWDEASSAMGAWFIANKAKPLFANRRFRLIDARGAYKEDDPTAPGGRKFKLINPKTKEIIPLRPNRGWAFDQETFDRYVEEGRISFITSTSIMKRTYFHETEKATPQSVIYQPVRSASERLARTLGQAVFDFPKDEFVLQKFIEMASDPNSLIVDFFAGSGSTAHAVINENLRDGGSRKFILVQIPEATPEESNARAAGFSTISEVTIKRVERVIEGFAPNSQPIPDTGFKVYKLSKSNFPRCEFAPDPKLSEEENIEALKRYIDDKEASFLLPLEDSAEQAIFDEVLLKCGFQLHYTRSRREDFTENTVYEIQDGHRSALVCLAWNESIKDATIKRLRELDEAKEKPFFICLERSLNTTTKWNLDHLLGKRLTAF
jgi:adenine-specific DNA-methyltransferase